MATLSFDARPYPGLSAEARRAFHEDHADKLRAQVCETHDASATVAVEEVTEEGFEFQLEGCCDHFLTSLTNEPQQP